MTKLETAILAACQSFLAVYRSEITEQSGQQRIDTAPKLGNIPTCEWHRIPMAKRQGPRGEFFSCPEKGDDPRYFNDRGYCKYRP